MTGKKPMCGECAWLDKGITCRRFPPKQTKNLHYAVWPNVYTTDWCGEYKAREVAKDAAEA